MIIIFMLQSNPELTFKWYSYDLHTARKAAEDLGPHLNFTKSKIISVDSHTRDTMLTAVQELCVVSPDQATLLDSPIGSINSAMRSKVNTLTTIGSRIHHLHAQDAAFGLLHHMHILSPKCYISSIPPRVSSHPNLRNLTTFRDLSSVILPILT